MIFFGTQSYTFKLAEVTSDSLYLYLSDYVTNKNWVLQL